MDLFDAVKRTISFSKDYKYKLYPAGSIYRNPDNPSPGDVDILLVSPEFEDGILSTFVSKKPVQIIRQGERMMSLKLFLRGNQYTHVDIWACSRAEYPFMLLAFAGGPYTIRIQAVAKQRGFLLNRYGLYHRDSGKKVRGTFKTVADIQRAIGVTVRNLAQVDH